MNALQYIANFKATPFWAEMVRTVENSPWHREDNVGVHTEMCLEQYLTRFAPHRSERQNTIALIAILYHDVGKPDAEETLEKKDGSGTYRRYAGHEQLSAVAFTDRWLQDHTLREVLSVEDARAVRFIIEHHLPYGLKDGAKRSALRTAMEHALREDVETFYDVLRSDAAGRTSDDHETKLQNVEDWIREFRTVPLVMNRIDTSMGKCYVMVGPSGSGKTTWMRKYLKASDKVVSLDAYRLDFYDRITDDPKAAYRAAWQHCVDNEKDFNAFVDAQVKSTFRDLRITKGSVFIDNVNSSRKTRARYIQEARNLGMKVVAVEFWNTLFTLILRQVERPDKQVPLSSVEKQLHAQTCTLKGSEVDEVIVVHGT